MGTSFKIIKDISKYSHVDYKLFLIKFKNDPNYWIWRAYYKIKNYKELIGRDYLAYWASNHFGFNFVPKSKLCEKEYLIGCANQFISGTRGNDYIKTHNDFENKSMQKLALFDYIINNCDRALSNIIIDRGKKIWAIDHNCAFCPYQTTTHSLIFLFKDINMNIDLLNIIKKMYIDRLIYKDLIKKYNMHENVSNFINMRIMQLYCLFVESKVYYEGNVICGG